MGLCVIKTALGLEVSRFSVAGCEGHRWQKQMHQLEEQSCAMMSAPPVNVSLSHFVLYDIALGEEQANMEETPTLVLYDHLHLAQTVIGKYLTHELDFFYCCVYKFVQGILNW